MPGNNNFVSTRVADGPHPWRRQLHRGWIDAQHRKGYAPEYEKMNVSEQIAYEQARLLVHEAMAEGFGIPVWRGDKAGSGVADDLWMAVCRKLGRRVTPGTGDYQ